MYSANKDMGSTDESYSRTAHGLVPTSELGSKTEVLLNTTTVSDKEATLRRAIQTRALCSPSKDLERLT